MKEGRTKHWRHGLPFVADTADLGVTEFKMINGYKFNNCWFGCVLVCSVTSDSATSGTTACQAPLCMGFFQARILEQVAILCSRGSSQPRDRTHISYISCIGRQVLYH